MTREELNKLIMQACERTWNEKTCKEIEQALSQEPTYYPPCIDCNKKMDEIRRAYDKLKEQEPCEDWYDVPSDEMTLEQARQAVKDLRKKLAEHLEQKPCDNTISRDAVLDAVSEGCQELRGVYGRCEDLINALPPVTHKSGKWIDHSYEEGYVECPFCGYATNCEGNIDELHYCFYCGARMESEDKE